MNARGLGAPVCRGARQQPGVGHRIASTNPLTNACHCACVRVNVRVCPGDRAWNITCGAAGAAHEAGDPHLPVYVSSETAYGETISYVCPTGTRTWPRSASTQ